MPAVDLGLILWGETEIRLKLASGPTTGYRASHWRANYICFLEGVFQPGLQARALNSNGGYFLEGLQRPSTEALTFRSPQYLLTMQTQAACLHHVAKVLMAREGLRPTNPGSWGFVDRHQKSRCPTKCEWDQIVL